MRIISVSFFNNVYGLEIVKRCLKAGININVIVFIGDKISDLEKKLISERTPSITGPSITEEIFSSIPVHIVKKLDSETSLSLLQSLNPDLIIQGGGPIYKQSVLDIPKIGVLNCHPGLLPKYRGSSCVEWAIYNGDPVGATCHFLDAGVDSGPIVFKRELKIKAGESYQDVRTNMFYHQASLMVEGIQAIIKGLTKEKAQIQGEGTTWKVPQKEILAEVMSKLEKRDYKHFS